METKKHYDVAVDTLRILSILAVIFIHTTTKTLETSAFALEKIPFTLFLNQILRFAVPLFFMISGFVLELNFHLNENYLTYLKKRLNRIFIPYIFWSAVYYFFVYKSHTESFFKALMSGDASYQLYFIPALLIFYLIFPFIHNFYKYLRSIWITISFALIELVLLYYDYYIHPIALFSPIRIALFNYFVFYSGIILANNKEGFMAFIKKWKILLFLSSCILAIIIYLEGLGGYLKTHNYLTFYSQWRPSVLIYTFFLAGFLYWVFNRINKYISIIKTLSKLSFFVFFIHVIILETLWYLIGAKNFNLGFVKNLWWDPLYFIGVTLISFSIAYIAHKIPYFSKLTG